MTINNHSNRSHIILRSLFFMLMTTAISPLLAQGVPHDDSDRFTKYIIGSAVAAGVASLGYLGIKWYFDKEYSDALKAAHKEISLLTLNKLYNNEHFGTLHKHAQIEAFRALIPYACTDHELHEMLQSEVERLIPHRTLLLRLCHDKASFIDQAARTVCIIKSLLTIAFKLEKALQSSSPQIINGSFPALVDCDFENQIANLGRELLQKDYNNLINNGLEAIAIAQKPAIPFSQAVAKNDWKNAQAEHDRYIKNFERLERDNQFSSLHNKANDFTHNLVQMRTSIEIQKQQLQYVKARCAEVLKQKIRQEANKPPLEIDEKKSKEYLEEAPLLELSSYDVMSLQNKLKQRHEMMRAQIRQELYSTFRILRTMHEPSTQSLYHLLEKARKFHLQDDPEYNQIFIRYDEKKAWEAREQEIKDVLRNFERVLSSWDGVTSFNYNTLCVQYKKLEQYGVMYSRTPIMKQMKKALKKYKKDQEARKIAQEARDRTAQQQRLEAQRIALQNQQLELQQAKRNLEQRQREEQQRKHEEQLRIERQQRAAEQAQRERQINDIINQLKELLALGAACGEYDLNAINQLVLLAHHLERTSDPTIKRAIAILQQYQFGMGIPKTDSSNSEEHMCIVCYNESTNYPKTSCCKQVLCQKCYNEILARPGAQGHCPNCRRDQAVFGIQNPFSQT